MLRLLLLYLFYLYLLFQTQHLLETDGEVFLTSITLEKGGGGISASIWVSCFHPSRVELEPVI